MRKQFYTDYHDTGHKIKIETSQTIISIALLTHEIQGTSGDSWFLISKFESLIQ